jgi:hypothetical protein
MEIGYHYYDECRGMWVKVVAYFNAFGRLQIVSGLPRHKAGMLSTRRCVSILKHQENYLHSEAGIGHLCNP